MTIPVGAVLGHLCVTDVVTTIPKQKSTTGDFDASMINFGESPVPEGWKARLRQKLLERTDVFSLDELDVGLAKEVEHPIQAHCSSGYRRHIQKLLAAGIIKESRSPYASPIVVVRKKNGNVRMCSIAVLFQINIPPHKSMKLLTASQAVNGFLSWT